MAMLMLIGFTSFVFSLCFHGVVSAACSANAIASCLGGLSNGHASFQSFGQSQLNSVCRQVANMESCLKNLDCHGSSTVVYTQWHVAVNLADGMNYLCSNEARDVLVNNAQCIQTAALSAESLRCTTDFVKVTISTKSHGAICTAYNTAIKCQYHALKAKCNEDVGRVYATYVQKALRGYMSEDCAVDNNYKQQSYGSENGVGRVTSSLTSSVMLFIVSLMLSRR